MLPTVIAAIFAVTMAAVWAVYTQRRLMTLSENVTNAMNQIGVQLSCRFDALVALLELAKGFAGPESQALTEAVHARRVAITGKSTPEEVLRQEAVISETLEQLALIAERYPELRESQPYRKTLGAVETFENMVRTSRLIYNDSVQRFNRQARRFPACLVAGAIGLHQRGYLGNGAEGPRKNASGRPGRRHAS